MSETVKHTAACWAMPKCLVCGLRKKPYGRDAGVVAASGYCVTTTARDTIKNRLWDTSGREKWTRTCAVSSTPDTGGLPSTTVG